jgi:hypothetical protein
VQSRSDLAQQPRNVATQAENNATNMIARHLQIPESVNKSKGSLAEFAAEVRPGAPSMSTVMLTSNRLPVFSGLKVPQPLNTQKKLFNPTLQSIGPSFQMLFPRPDFENGSRRF